MRFRDVLAWAALALFLALGAYGCSLGWGTDRDSLRVIAAAQSLLSGVYLRSRSFGFPLHEAACAILFRVGGLAACNAGSLVVTACGIVLAARLVPPARLLRAGVFLSSALGPGGACAVIVLAGRGGDGSPEAVFLRRAAWLSWALYLPRFAALPDQMEYLILPVCLSMVAFLAGVPDRLAVWVCVAFCVPSLATISVFRRDGATGALRVHLAPQWGAVAQDWTARRFARRVEGEPAVAAVAARTGLASLRYDVFMPGYVSPDSDLVIGQAHLYRVVPMGGGVGALATVPRGLYRAIWVCDAPLGPGIGWRGWEAPVVDRGAPGTCERK